MMDGSLTGPGAAEIRGASRPLRILVSACACEPDEWRGPGYAWQLAVTLAWAGHHVWVLTGAGSRAAIDRALAQRPQARLHPVYYDPPGWMSGWNRGELTLPLRNLLWQMGACGVARELDRAVSFDVAHHVGTGGFGLPPLLAFLEVPCVVGPVGGGAATPRWLRGTFPIRGFWADLLRDAGELAARFDPVSALAYRKATAILCRSRVSLNSIPERYREKCLLQPALGVGPERASPPSRRVPVRQGFRVLYVGRLAYRKGVHLGLMAFAMFRQERPDARLTIIGDGPDENWLRHIALMLGLRDAVNWVPSLPHAAVMRSYARHDAFLFPGLHDAGGAAALEAMTSGLPVVCVAAGEPGELVDASCGIKVDPADCDTIVAGLAEGLFTLADDPDRLRAMGAAATRRALSCFSWTAQAARMASLYRALHRHHSSSSSGTATQALA